MGKGSGGSGRSGSKTSGGSGVVGQVASQINAAGGLHAALSADRAFRSDGLPRADRVSSFLAGKSPFQVNKTLTAQIKDPPTVVAVRSGTGYKLKLQDGNHRIQLGKQHGGSRIRIELQVEVGSRLRRQKVIVDL